MNIFEKIKKLREEKGMSQEAFADFLGIGLASIKNYEEKQRLPKNDILLEISKKCDVSIDYLLNDNIDIRHYKDINIGEELKLSNEGIEKIRKLTEIHNLFLRCESIDLSKRFDSFITNVRLDDLLVSIEMLHWLSEMYHCYISQLRAIGEMQELAIQWCNQRDKESIKKLIKYNEELLKRFKEFVEDYYKITSFYSPYDKKYEEIFKYFNKIKQALNNFEVKEYKGCFYIEYMSEYLNCLNDIATEVLTNIDIQRYRINEIIMEYTKQVITEEATKWEDIYGGRRNNKK